jgi:hypothetical protein
MAIARLSVKVGKAGKAAPLFEAGMKGNAL